MDSTFAPELLQKLREFMAAPIQPEPIINVDSDTESEYMRVKIFEIGIGLGQVLLGHFCWPNPLLLVPQSCHPV